MENQELIKQVTEKAEKWLTPAYDAETQAEVKRMLENPDKTELSEYNIGGLLYFFEKACGICGYLLGVIPFNQPGVEAYKKNMFALLNKPGYEEESKAIQAKL